MDYAVNRFYNAAQGRFTQVDPIGMSAASLKEPQTLNLYSYCGNDPVNHLDPDGLFWGKLFKWVGKAFKWIAIAATIAIAVLTIAPGAWAGVWLAKLSIWAAKHQILASLLGLHTPQWAIVNLASAAGATAAGFWVMAGVGAVNSLVKTKNGKKNSKKKAPCYPNWNQLIGPNGIYNQLLKPLGVKQTWSDPNQMFHYSQTTPRKFGQFVSKLEKTGWEQFYGDPHPDHLGYDDFRKKYKGEWYHLSVKRPFVGWAGKGIMLTAGEPAGFTIHWEEAEPGSLGHLGNKIGSVLTGTPMGEYRGIPECK
jgi:RHS repeat-associated protein